MLKRKIELLEKLEEVGLINADQRCEAEAGLHKTRKSISDILIDMGLCTNEEAAEIMELLYDAPFVKLSGFTINPDAVAIVPEAVARKHRLIPIDVKDRAITVAMSDPQSLDALDDLRAVSNRRVVALVADPLEIDSAIAEYYSMCEADYNDTLEKMGITLDETEDAVVEEISDRTDAERLEITDLRSMGHEAPVVQLVNQIVLRAVRAEASDIHIEPVGSGLLVRLRVDGILQDNVAIPRSMQPAVISRIKILSKMDIAERRVPQDGRFQARVEGSHIDFRVSTLPGIMGEKVVIRLLDLSGGAAKLSELGIDERDYDTVIRMIRKTTGVVIVTGPTGSGKTTTLYSVLDMLRSPEKNIITIEDPVEYRLARICQVQVNPKAGLEFAGVLRNVLRQDPDIIMVGEMRDVETSELAVRSALTGHLVLSTLHTNNAAQALTRLRDMKLNPFIIGATINGIIAQRLVRKLCPKCKQPTVIDDKTLDLLGEGTDMLRGVEVFEPKGCPACRNKGYTGRVGVYEIMPTDSPLLRDLILMDRPASEVWDTGRRELGLRSLREAGYAKVLQGTTSIEEVMRVTL